jgi:hypothetical protein
VLGTAVGETSTSRKTGTAPPVSVEDRSRLRRPAVPLTWPVKG